MRISDWSSDVCSSDRLELARGLQPRYPSRFATSSRDACNGALVSRESSFACLFRRKIGADNFIESLLFEQFLQPLLMHSLEQSAFACVSYSACRMLPQSEGGGPAHAFPVILTSQNRKGKARKS